MSPIFSGKMEVFLGIFDTLVENFNISTAIPVHGAHFNDTGYDLLQEEGGYAGHYVPENHEKGLQLGGGGRQKADRSSLTLKVFECPLFFKKMEEPAELLWAASFSPGRKEYCWDRQGC